MMWVRFPSPAPRFKSRCGLVILIGDYVSGCDTECKCAHIAQSVEHFLGKEEVIGSNPIVSTNIITINRLVSTNRGKLKQPEAASNE